MGEQANGVKIEDIAYVRFRAPDLGEMRTFLEEFGLAHVSSSDKILYMRGAGSAPFLHATELGEPGFVAMGLRAESVGDLESLARRDGGVIEASPYPGGGKILRLTDPDGYCIEVIAGQENAKPLPIESETPHNNALAKPRLRATLRVAAGPAHVARLGHAVLNVADFRVSEAWYKERFGFITSDEIEVAPGASMGAFLRCDRGDTPTDHHTLFLLQAPTGPGFNHAAFEVASMDDLMRGHAHLKGAKRKAAWGVGRHILGSQIFDYWKDPWGHELEHWTDGDLFTAADGSNKVGLQDLLAVQWGQPHPMFAAQQGDNP